MIQNQKNPFDKLTGSNKLGSTRNLSFILVSVVITAMIIGKTGLLGGMGLLLFPFIIFYSALLITKPIAGIYSAVFLGFALLGLSRYLPAMPIGIAMDAVLILTYLSLVFHTIINKTSWRAARKDVTLLAAIWFAYAILQFFNPELKSKEAWLAGMRGVSLYMFLIIPLALILVDTKRKLDVFLYIWGVLSIFASLKGIMQLTIGPDAWEQSWLDGGGAATHILFGKLRIFSFMSDAGQFGANQAYSAVVASIVFLAEKDRGKKFFYFLVAALGIYGMFISGTRGAISIPIFGYLLFTILHKNWYVFFTGILAIALVFVFFKYTYIGQDIYEIRRMRTAFDPNNPSLTIRLDNQKKLANYLIARPFGGGIGHAGVKAKRYQPDSFLSQIPTDSWYVLIWAEQGIIGLGLYLFILFYILIKSAYIIMFRIRDKILRLKMAALEAGLCGVIIASYGNTVVGQFPTNILVFISMALLINARRFDTEEPLEGKPELSQGTILSKN